MENNNNNNVIEEEISLKELWEIFVRNFWLFAISVAVCLFIGLAYIFITPPTYERSASVLIKDEEKGKSISAQATQGFDELGLFQSQTNINNELAVLRRPLFMQEVVKRLGLNYNYKVKDSFVRWSDLYNNTPYKIELDSLLVNSSISFKVNFISRNQYVISDMIVDLEEYDAPITSSIGSVTATPWGDITLTTTPFFDETTLEKTYSFSHNSIKKSADNLLKLLNVTLQSKDATVVDLSITSEVPQRAENILNTLISIYNENWIKDKNEITLNTNIFISDRLNAIEQELGVVDGDISSFKSQNLIPDITATANIQLAQSSENRSQQLLLENQLSMAKYIRDYLLDSSKSNQLIPASTGINSNAIEGEISKYNELLLQRDVLLANSGVRNPLVIDMNEQLVAIRDVINRSINDLIGTLTIQIQSAQRVEVQNKAEIAKNPNQAKELINIERQQTVKEALYLFLLQKREENELSQAFTAYNTKILRVADGSEYPIAPRKLIILLFAMVIGVVLPAAYLFVKMTFDTLVKSKKDIEGLNIPFVGSVPSIDTGSKKKIGLGKKGKKTDMPTVVDSKSDRSISNEAFRVIRTNLDFILGKKDTCRVIQVVSLNPSSGKSFISANLSNSMSMKKGVKVLVIDCDMRKYALSKYVGSPKQGLSNYLNGAIEGLDNIIIKA